MWKRVAQSSLLVLALAAGPVIWAQTSLLAAPASLIPANLNVPDQNVQLFRTSAIGYQIYVCKAKADDPNIFEWTFKAPEAELRNEAGEKVGKHYAGPSWEGNDGSKVVGEVVERSNAPEASAIPWLLLKARANDGAGAFSTVTYVQRIETVGGIAPTEGCDRSTVDSERGVEYTATYTFYYGAAR
jgi:hypothetical protein